MSYYPAATSFDQVDDFDEYDPTPYGGGYDLGLTFGRPLPPSEETCYPISSPSSSIDYERPQYSSYSQSSSAYGGSGEEAFSTTETDGYSRPKPSSFQQQEVQTDEEIYGLPQANYGFRPGMNRPSYGSGDHEEIDKRPPSEYGFGHGGKPKREEYSSSYGSYGEEQSGGGYVGRPKRQEEAGYAGTDAYGYGGRTDYERPNYEQPQYERPSYGQTQYERPSYEQPQYERSSYGGEKEPPRRPSYGVPSYEPQADDGFPRKPSYGYGHQEEEQEPRRYYDRDQGEGYSRPNYGNGSDDDDEEKKRRHHKHHHHRKYSDDE